MIETDPKKTGRNLPRWLDAFLAGGALLAYLLYLTGDYFLGWSPLKGRTLFWIVLALVALGLAIRLYITKPDRFRSWPSVSKRQLILNWPLLVLLFAFILDGVLRWQAIQKPPALTDHERQFAAAAINIVKRSDWKPPDFSQPPLYLYTNALFAEALTVQGASKPGAVGIDELQPETYLSDFRYLNLGLGLLTLLPVYGAGALLFGRRGGAVAALLFAGAWISYRATPLLVPQTLAAFLAAVAFYLLVRQSSTSVQTEERMLSDSDPQTTTNPKVFSQNWLWFWIGAVCGLATATTYGAIFLLIPLFFFANSRTNGIKQLKIQNSKFKILLGWLLAFTLTVSGWLLNLPGFLNGLAAIGGAPSGAPKFYLKEFAGHDLALALGLFFALLLPVNIWILRLRSQEANAETPNNHPLSLIPLLSFPLLYLLSLLFVGPLDGSRLALIAPFLALCTAYPVEYASRFMAQLLDDDRHRWAGTATAFGLVLLLTILSLFVRRFF